MGEILMTGGSGGGTGSDECTATLDHVLAGETAVTSDSNDEPGTGRMTVNSLLSFSVAAYSGRRVLLKWQNPYAAAGKPYSGVIIKASRGGYPAWNASAWDAIFSGAGNNVAPGAWSQAFMDLPALNTTYYFTALTYAITSLGEIYSPVYDPSTVKYAVCATNGPAVVTITGTQNYVIPEGYTQADIFCVGGGGGGGAGYRFTGIAYEQGGGGGGGGYTATAHKIGVAAGHIMKCVIGNRGGQNTAINGPGGTGGTTSVSRGGIVLCTANGGKGGDGASGASGGYGGSRGGSGGYNDLESRPVINAGGNGYADGAGTGSQGYTTRAFGEAGNTLYAGGGGGGGVSRSNPGAGGAGGGGAGGAHNGTGNAGAANTGGGGGGGGGAVYGTAIAGGPGGSGVVLIRLK